MKFRVKLRGLDLFDIKCDGLQKRADEKKLTGKEDRKQKKDLHFDEFNETEKKLLDTKQKENDAVMREMK